ncbi:MAG: hypothetical protein J0L92_21220 [Deltaproteobacteria bacterium]|nr:hypothetical protein [Deltaproteobacteria bacterium]
MFEALRALQIGLWMGILATGIGLGRRLFLTAIDGGALVRRLRGLPHARVVASLSRAPAPLSLVAVGADATEDGEAELALREQGLAAERWAARGLAWLRILGMVASALGFVAVAHQISWLHADHGLLDLDPTRVGRMAAERAAAALALAIAASGTGVTLGGLLRARVRVVLRELSAAQDLLERARRAR